jgi:hypothetical protein
MYDFGIVYYHVLCIFNFSKKLQKQTDSADKYIQ